MLQFFEDKNIEIDEERLLRERLLDNHAIQYLYHMTHIDNLLSILSQGLYAHDNKYQKVDISDCDVNSRRAHTENVYNKPIHSYVPFYFNPKNAMLYKRRSIQNDIVILVLKRDILLSKGSLFTDGNASSDTTSFFNNLDGLSQLDWGCINDDNWNSHDDGRRTRMAEVLVPDFVDAKNILGIICNNPHTKAKIDALPHNKTASLVSTKLYF